MLNRLRRRLDVAIARRIDARWHELTRALHEDRVRELDGLRREMRELADHFGGDYGYMRAEFDRIAPQVAALEYRMEEVRRAMDIDVSDDATALRKAEIEHERARLRLELVAHYEERLRRLETVAPTSAKSEVG